MRKTLTSFLPLLFAISCEGDPSGDTSDFQVDNPCPRVCKNLCRLIRSAAEGDPDIVRDRNFARVLADAIAARNATEANKNDIDYWLKRLFLPCSQFASRIDLLDTLKKLSENINRNTNNKSFLLLANTRGEQQPFVDLGNVFRSNGVEYAVICNKNIFFSDAASQNTLFFDKAGKTYTKLEFLHALGKKPLSICPVLDLEAKQDDSNPTVVHLGGFSAHDKPLSMPFLLSLVRLKAAFQRKQNKIKPKNRQPCGIQLLKQDGDNNVYNFPNIEVFASNIGDTPMAGFFTPESGIVSEQCGTLVSDNEKKDQIIFCQKAPLPYTIPTTKIDGLGKLKNMFAKLARWQHTEDGGNINDDLVFKEIREWEDNAKKLEEWKNEVDRVKQEIEDLNRNRTSTGDITDELIRKHNRLNDLNSQIAGASAYTGKDVVTIHHYIVASSISQVSNTIEIVNDKGGKLTYNLHILEPNKYQCYSQ